MDARTRIVSPMKFSASQNGVPSAEDPEQSSANESTGTNTQAFGSVISKTKTSKNPLKKIPTRIKTRSEKKASDSGAKSSKIRSPLGYELHESTEDISEPAASMKMSRHDAVTSLPTRTTKLGFLKKIRPSNESGLRNIVSPRAKAIKDHSEESTTQSKSNDDQNSASSSRSPSDTNAARPEFQIAHPIHGNNRSHFISHLNRDLFSLKEKKLDREFEELQGELDELTAITDSYIQERKSDSPSLVTSESQLADAVNNLDLSVKKKRIVGATDKKRSAYVSKHADPNGAAKIATAAHILREEKVRLDQYLPYLPYLPAGATLNADGIFEGEHISHTFPEKTIHTKWKNIIAEEFATRGNNLINSQKLPPKYIGNSNVKAVNSAEADFRRAKFQIPHRNGSPNIEGRFTDSGVVARALRDFTGNDNVALVLSSLMNQETSAALLLAMPNQSGGDLFPHLRIITIAQARQMSKDFNIQLDTEGTYAQFTLSRSGEDYKITVTLNSFLEQAHEQLLPMRKDEPIEVHFETEIIVIAAAAREGVLELQMPEGIKAKWKGRLDSSLVK